MIRLKIDALEDAVTIEDYLLKSAKLSPRSALKDAFLAKKILLNGKVAARTFSVHVGDTIEIQSESVFAKDSAALLANPSLHIPVLFESSSLIVIDKPAGLNCHPLLPSATDTVMNGVAAIAPAAAVAFDPAKPLEGGLVHRLDRGTSGVLIAAKKPESFSLLKAEWKNTVKVYLAWVPGDFQMQGTLQLQLSHAGKSGKTMEALTHSHRSQASWMAKTEILPVRYTEEHTLLLVQIHTGVMHQIRASLAYLGYPVVGDALYENATPGEATKLSELGAELPQLAKVYARDWNALPEPRVDALPAESFFLHAYYLKNESIEELRKGVFAPLPKHFKG